jgi:hypothetical protein
MANYYAFTKNQKPVLGSPIQGKKPRGGKSTPIYLGEDCLVQVSYSFPNEGDSYPEVDSYRLNLQVASSPYPFNLRLGYVYTGSRLTKQSFLTNINAKFGKTFEFKFIEDELFIVRSFVGTVTDPYINFILD